MPKTELPKKHVCVIGAGIAGLTVAHELVRRGHTVSVYESEPDAGGFFRSAIRPEHDGMPSEYSWHGFGPWYRNTFDLLQQITIPVDYYSSVGLGPQSHPPEEQPWTTVYQAMLSRPINFGLAYDDGTAEFESARRMFKLGPIDLVRWAWLMLKTWTADLRSDVHYSQLGATEAFRTRMSDLSWKAWRACFGPWVGSDWTRVSLHHVGQFFRRNFFSGEPHEHDGWTHGGGDGWLVLCGPSSDAWFAPWVLSLQTKGVKFYFGHRLKTLTMEEERSVISNAVFERDGELEQAVGEREADVDHYVLAISPFAARDVFSHSDLHAMLPGAPCPDRSLFAELHTKFCELVQDGPHTQVSFRIAFADTIRWKLERQAIVLADSEWNITIFAQEQAWGHGALGKGVGTLWTGTACVSLAPGRLFHLPLESCSREQFEREIIAQIVGCDGFWSQIEIEDDMASRLRSGLKHGWSVIRFEVWHEWLFNELAIQPKQPKWVTTTNTQRHVPTQRTEIMNLLLAGAHTKTDADVWSIEGAVESGRRAARLIDPSVEVLPQHKPLLLRVISELDNVCFKLGLPHVLTMSVWAAVLLAVTLICLQLLK